MSDEYLDITTYDQAQEALDEAMRDATADYPDTNPDDVAHDMIVAVSYRISDPAVKKEWFRVQLGFTPHEAREVGLL